MPETETTLFSPASTSPETGAASSENAMAAPTNTAVVKAEPALPSVQEQPQEGNLLAVIARAVADPRCDVEKMERLLAMHELITADQRKAAFMAALSRLQARLPQIEKTRAIVVKEKERSRYAAIEDIDQAIRPLLAEEGLALSFDCDSKDAKVYVVSCKLSHREGYSESKSLTLPLDSSDFRSGVQSVGSTISYARRTLIKMHLNMIEKGEDNDGIGGFISEQQITTLAKMIKAANANLDLFLKYMEVQQLSDIPARYYSKALNALTAKIAGATK